VRVHFCTHDPNPNLTDAEPGLGADFVFHPRVHPKLERNPKPEEKLKTQKKPEKTPERNPKETHLQNPTGTQTRPETQRVRVPNFIHGFGFGCQIQPDYIFSRVRFSVDLTQTRPIAIPRCRKD
jgi:hypothetical protein